MQLDGPPTDVPQIGKIEIYLFLAEGGIEIGFGMDQVTEEAAIGYLTVVQDRLREIVKYQWGSCPGCNKPWAEHDTPDDDYDEEDE